MGVHEAIREAEAVLPGEPVDDGEDSRWRAISEVGEYIESEPEAVWSFVLRWGGYPQEDLRSAIACCLLEHLLECHFSAYFPRIETLALVDPLFGDTFQRCWKFGQAEEPANAARFELLAQRLREVQTARIGAAAGPGR
jgi:hypothetical protein